MCDFVEQLRAEQRERWRKGEKVPAEEYLARHDELRADEELALEVIYQEILLREELGETPPLAEYQQRFPHFAARLQVLFEVHGVFGSAESMDSQANHSVPPSTIVGPVGDWPPYRKPVPPPTPLPLIPGYELLEELGQGGMAIVYKARQSELDRLVAVKVLSPQLSGDPAFAERFGREARVLARLGHPNIVAVHNVGQAGGHYYLVMEYVEGMNLRQALRAGTLRPQDVLILMEQLCDALQHAHDQGVIHRDIKPENLLLDRHGRLKVADFGLAKLLRSGSAVLTGTKQMMGTWHYMAPEQIKGARDVDHRADLYSLGVTFYELLTGELPVERVAPPSRQAGVDRRLDAVVLRALEKEPARRHQSAAEIKTAIETLLHSAGSVGPEPTQTRGGSPRQASSYLLWVALPAVMLLLVLLVASCAGLGRDPDGALATLWLSFDGLLIWSLALLVASLVWLFRRRDVGTVVPICGFFALVVGLWGLAAASEQLFIAKLSMDPLAEARPGGVVLSAWRYASPVFNAVSGVGWFVGGVGLLLWRGWARRLVVATSWLGVGYYALELPVYVAFVMASEIQSFPGAGEMDERSQFYAGVGFMLMLAFVVVVRVASTVGQVVMLRRAEVVRAFLAEGEGQARNGAASGG